MIYVVGVPPKNADSFGIWSTPAGHLVWKRDPLALPIGAGPVPTEQIVLAGSGGWILNVNRTVIIGRALVVRQSLERVELLRASARTVRLPGRVNEHRPDRDVRGGRLGPANAGQQPCTSRTTAARRSLARVAPGFGPVAAATPTTAVVGGNGTLWRTTDGGASWSVGRQVRARRTRSRATSASRPPTQGFVIVQNGEMLMTHDAGATWQASDAAVRTSASSSSADADRDAARCASCTICDDCAPAVPTVAGLHLQFVRLAVGRVHRDRERERLAELAAQLRVERVHVDTRIRQRLRDVGVATECPSRGDAGRR